MDIEGDWGTENTDAQRTQSGFVPLCFKASPRQCARDSKSRSAESRGPKRAVRRNLVDIGFAGEGPEGRSRACERAGPDRPRSSGQRAAYASLLRDIKGRTQRE